MPCYVVKRSNGKYLSHTGYIDTSVVWQALLFDEKEEANAYCIYGDTELVKAAIREVE